MSILRTTLDQQRLKPLRSAHLCKLSTLSVVGRSLTCTGPHQFWVCMRCSVVLGVARRALLFVFRSGSTRTAIVRFLKHLMTVEVHWANRASISLVSGVVRQLCPTVRVVWYILGLPVGFRLKLFRLVLCANEAPSFRTVRSRQLVALSLGAYICVAPFSHGLRSVVMFI